MENIDETGPGGGSRTRGFCKCPKCGYETIHDKDLVCAAIKCPECGTILERDMTI